MIDTDSDLNFNIRIAEAADAWAVELLFGALHAYNTELDERFALAEAWTEVLAEHLEHTQKHQNGVNLLAWQAERPIGLIMMDGHTDSPLFKHRRWAEIVALYVDSTVRKSNVAPRLLEAGLGWAHHHGYERVQLFVTASNERAKRFYARSGFRPVQEIWRIELADVDQFNGMDDICESDYAQGVNLLSTHQHKLVHDHNEQRD